MTNVGRWTCSIVQAMVALLPLPVMPSSVWNRSPRSRPLVNSAMAVGWSPEGSKSDTMRNGFEETPSGDAKNSVDVGGADESGILTSGMGISLTRACDTDHPGSTVVSARSCDTGRMSNRSPGGY